MVAPHSHVSVGSRSGGSTSTSARPHAVPVKTTRMVAMMARARAWLTRAMPARQHRAMARRQFDQIIADGWAGIEAWQRDRELETHHLEFKRHVDEATGAFTPQDAENLAAAVSGF